MQMAMMAHTLDSRPIEIPASTVVAGPVRVASAIWSYQLGRGEVLGDERFREHDADEHGRKNLRLWRRR